LDLLIRNGTVISMNRAREVLPATDVLVRGRRIVRVGKRLQSPHGARVIDAAGQLVLPGLIHGHLHACQTLFRNRADGLELLDWLQERIWPMEAAHDRASMRASADLTFVELLKSGATALLDMGSVRHYQAVFESARDCGIRLTGGKAMMDAPDTPKGLKEDTARSVADSLALLKRWHGAEDGRLRYAFCPRFVLSCTEPLLKQVAELATAWNARIHTHASENRTECELVRQRTGKDNVAYFHSLKLAGPHVTLAHGVWLSEEERRLLVQSGTVVCHCPSSNLKLASGIAQVPELLDQGVHVCLGSDGAPCTNNLDIFTEMRLAALLHKPRLGPLAMPAMRVLELATVQGARGLGLEHEIGSIEEGKRADLIVVDLSRAHATPGGEDPVAQLVYSGKGEDVRHAIVDGRLLMKDRKLLTLDEEEVLARARKHALRVARAIEPKAQRRRKSA
jgi:cytosine/adenosine deaminase-related metal-dependent hydrolase